MNTLNYIGCKNKLFNTLLKICKENIDDIKNKTFMDLFSGTGVVGFNMMQHFLHCSANDMEYYSYVINYALLKCSYTENIRCLIEICNNLDSVEGLIYHNFSPTNTCERMFFTNGNAKKADAIRKYIGEKFAINEITEDEFHFLLASLLVSIDKVANTSCVYGAYLKEFKKPSLKDLVLTPIHKNTVININNTNNTNQVYNGLAEKFAEEDAAYYDVVYIDPPYNQRQYSANYSPLNYIAYYDKNIILKGKTALIENYNKSDFCKKTEVKKAFTNLINGIKCNYLIISYNNEGLLTREELQNILLKKGSVKLYKIKYNKFKAQKNVDKQFVEEYLWMIDTSKKGELIIEIDFEMIK